MEKFVISYDLGTGGVKAALVNTKGQVLATGLATYPLYTTPEGLADQDAEDYWKGVIAATRAVFEKSGKNPADTLGIAFGTMWRGIIPVDKEGTPLCHGLIWLDARGVEEAKELNEKFGEGLFSPIDYWPKLLWLKKHKGDIVEKADMILEANAFLKMKLTGVATSDVSDCFVSSFDRDLDTFYGDVLQFIGVPREKFPPRVACHQLVGKVNERAAKELGIPAGLPVFGGSGDIPAIAIGAGCSKLNAVHIYFGSSGWVGYSVPHKWDELYKSAFDEKRDIALYGFQSVGLSYNMTVQKLYSAEYAEKGDALYKDVDREVSEIPAGSMGVFATPWFFGERQPLSGPDAKACFLGFGPNHDRRHAVRAVMEGICYGMALAIRQKHKDKGYPIPTEVRVIGGGAKSEVWMQMLADVLNMPVLIPAEPRHCGAVGVAYHALVGLGIADNYEQAEREPEKMYMPNPANAAVYEKNREIYKGLYAALHPFFQAVSANN